MENENDDDIDVIANGDINHVVGYTDEPLIDIHNAPRQQLFFSNSGNTEDNAASLHSLKVSYDVLKRRYNELEIKNHTMQKVITEMETERLGKEQPNLRGSFSGYDAAGPVASASPGAGTSEVSHANVRAHLGYAQRLERQIVRLQLVLEEQTQKYRKEIEQKYNENDQLIKCLRQKEEEIKLLTEKSLQSRGNMEYQDIQEMKSRIFELEDENRKLKKEACNNEEHIQALVQKGQMEQQKWSASMMSRGSWESDSTIMNDNANILSRIREQNGVIQQLQHDLTEQQKMIESQTALVKRVIEAARGAGVSLSSSITDLSRRVDGSSYHQNIQEQPHSAPRSPRSPNSSINRIQDSRFRYQTSSQFKELPKSANISAGIYRDGANLSPDYHDGSQQQQIGPVAAVKPIAVADQAGARPKTVTNPANLKFSPIIDDFSLNQSVKVENDKKTLSRKVSDLNVNYPPLQTIPAVEEENSPVNIQNRNKTFSPSGYLRQGEVSPRQAQQNTEVIANRTNYPKVQGKEMQENYTNFNFGYVPPSREDSSNNLFGSDTPKQDVRTQKQPQQNEDFYNPRMEMVENEYVNIWDTKNEGALTRPVIQETAGPETLTTTNRCPVCSQEFPRMSMQDFQMHVLHCIDDTSDDQLQTLQNVHNNPADTSNNRICPMCEAVFPTELPQEEFERHVQEHFGEENINDRFEVLNT